MAMTTVFHSLAKAAGAAASAAASDAPRITDFNTFERIDPLPLIRSWGPSDKRPRARPPQGNPERTIQASRTLGNEGRLPNSPLRDKPPRRLPMLSSTPGPLDDLGDLFLSGGPNSAGEAGEQAIAFGREARVRRPAFGVARKLRLQAVEEKHLMRPVVLRNDWSARLELEERPDVARHRLRDIDPARSAVRLHERGRIDRVSPDVEGELVLADDARHHWAAMDSDA